MDVSKVLAFCRSFARSVLAHARPSLTPMRAIFRARCPTISVEHSLQDQAFEVLHGHWPTAAEVPAADRCGAAAIIRSVAARDAACTAHVAIVRVHDVVRHLEPRHELGQALSQMQLARETGLQK